MSSSAGTSRNHELGWLSRKYEVGRGGPDTVSTGKGDHGGVSYGTYQLSSTMGTAQDFVERYYKDQFKGLKAGTREFTNKWHEVYRQEGQKFGDQQHEYIRQTHYVPVVQAVNIALGVNLDSRSDAVQNVVWSTAVQHGAKRGAERVQKALRSLAGATTSMRDEDIIRAIYAERGKTDAHGILVYFKSSSHDMQQGVAKRYRDEERDAMRALKQEKPHELLYREKDGWKEVGTFGHEGVKFAFEVTKDSGKYLRGVLGGSTNGRHKLYLALIKGGLYYIRYRGGDEAAQASKLADLNPNLDDAQKRQAEQLAKTWDAGLDAAFNCTIAAAGWVLGAYTGGVFLLIAGTAATGKCITSGIRFGERLMGKEDSIMDSTPGRIVDTSLTVLNLATGVKGTLDTGRRLFTSWRHLRHATTLGPYGRELSLKVAEMLFVDLPGVALNGYDLVTKFPGMSVTGSNLQQVLDAHQDSSSVPHLPYEMMVCSPTSWLREKIECPSTLGPSFRKHLP